MIVILAVAGTTETMEIATAPGMTAIQDGATEIAAMEDTGTMVDMEAMADTGTMVDMEAMADMETTVVMATLVAVGRFQIVTSKTLSVTSAGSVLKTI